VLPIFKPESKRVQALHQLLPHPLIEPFDLRNIGQCRGKEADPAAAFDR
jgi:hypothetical protein